MRVLVLVRQAEQLHHGTEVLAIPLRDLHDALHAAFDLIVDGLPFAHEVLGGKGKVMAVSTAERKMRIMGSN